MQKEKKVSIIIRVKNEERWISSCLKAINEQTYKNFEIIIVDNNSEDKTIEKARQYRIAKVVNIDHYLPGKSLNLGIKYSTGEYIVCISAHCLPVKNNWLEKLVKALEENKDYAGVYGRQEPMSFSTASDKRDMLLVFGLDRKIQIKDSFFHNANSIIHKKLWDKIHFDEKVTNIEDRIWAQTMINKGLKILYEPEASVYHYHGIHQNNNNERLQNIVSIIENQNTKVKRGKLDAKKLNIIALIPVKGLTKMLGNKYQLLHTIKSVQESKFVTKIIVSTDSKETAKIAEDAGAECPFLRPKNLSDAIVNLEKVQKYSLEKIEEIGILPDLIVHLEETFPFRPKGMIDGMITHLLEDGYDSVIAAKRESGWLWQESSGGNYKRLDSGDIPREFKEKSLVGLHGLGCITHPEFIRREKILGNKTGLYEIDYPLADFEVRNDTSAKFAAKLLDESSE